MVSGARFQELADTMKFLVGDIGGTKTLLAVVQIEGDGPPRLVCEARYESPRYPGLSPVVEVFLKEHANDGSFDAACFAVAGPVVGGAATTPNLPWQMDEGQLTAQTGVRTHLINDFAAVAYGVSLVAPADLLTLQQGSKKPRETIAVLGAGTGLGQAFATWQPGGYRVHTSEGGHADFAPRNPLECGLLTWLRARLAGRVSWERVLSGRGLVSVYRYFVEQVGEPESAHVREQMQSQDPASVVSEHALAHSDPTCEKALDLFVSLYGSAAGNLALTVFATGGVYIAGGIAPRLQSKLSDGAFMRAFNDKGRFSSVLNEVPVHVILNTRVGLFGAAAVAAKGE